MRQAEDPAVEYVPALHLVHSAKPLPENVPGEQVVHEVELTTAENVPEGQVVQELAIAPEYVPMDKMSAKSFHPPFAYWSFVFCFGTGGVVRVQS